MIVSQLASWVTYNDSSNKTCRSNKYANESSGLEYLVQGHTAKAKAWQPQGQDQTFGLKAKGKAND